MDVALGWVFGIVLLAATLVVGVLRYGLLFPRIGRWLDPRIYALFPRLGHLFIEADGPDKADEADEAKGPGALGSPEGEEQAAPPDERAFGR